MKIAIADQARQGSNATDHLQQHDRAGSGNEYLAALRLEAIGKDSANKGKEKR